VAEGYEREATFTLGIDVQQAIDAGVHEPAHHAGSRPRAVATASRLARRVPLSQRNGGRCEPDIPGVAPVGAGANDTKWGVSNGGFAPALRAGRGGNLPARRPAQHELAIAHAPLSIICTCTYWRNAWKYQARNLRHFGWDNGTLLANLPRRRHRPRSACRVVCGFVDASVNRLLDVDPQREVAFSLVALGTSRLSRRQLLRKFLRLASKPSRFSARGGLSPHARMHAASSLDSAAEVEAWRGHTPMIDFPPPTEPIVQLKPLSMRNAARPHRASHPAPRFHPQVCPQPNHVAAAFHHDRPRNAWRARGFPRSARSPAQ